MSDEQKTERFRLGDNGPWVSADPKLAAFLQGKGESPVGYAQSVPPTEGAEAESVVLKTSDLTVGRDRTPSVKPAKRPTDK